MDPASSKRRRGSLGTTAAAMTLITDVDVDVLVHCTGYLMPQEVSSMAMSCKFLKRVAYSDAVWLRLYRERWPWLVPAGFTTGVRRAYWDRLSAVQQFKFVDPLVVYFHPKAPYNGILLDKNRMVLAQGSTLQILKFDSSAGQQKYAGERYKHKAEITRMRLFPLSVISSSGGETEGEESALVTSSCDRSIRLWWEGQSQSAPIAPKARCL